MHMTKEAVWINVLTEISGRSLWWSSMLSDIVTRLWPFVLFMNNWSPVYMSGQCSKVPGVSSSVMYIDTYRLWLHSGRSGLAGWYWVYIW